MDSGRWLLAVLNSCAFLLCVGFLVYVLTIVRPYLRHPAAVPGRRDHFEWHLVVPCLNEQDVLAGTVRHLATTFPRAVLWCVDDGSDDATPRILADLARRHPNVRLVRRSAPDARRGKGAALNAAWRAIGEAVGPNADRDRIIVGVVDADGRLERHCLDVIAGPSLFGDDAVGAVQVLVRVTDDIDAAVSTDAATLDRRHHDVRRRRPSLLVQLQDMEFAGPIAAMQSLRRRTGSVGMGGNGQFTRLSVLDRIAAEYGTPWHGALLEDFELGLHVLLSGYRNEYCDDTFVAQSGLTRLRPLLRQRSRWSQGAMQCLRYLWPVLTSTRVELGGALEIAYYLYVPWSQLAGSIVFPCAAAVDLYYALGDPTGADHWLLAGAWAILPLALLFGVLPHAMWGLLYRSRTGNEITYRRAVLLGLANLGYGYLLQASVWWALLRLGSGRSDWKKTSHPGTALISAPVIISALVIPAPSLPTRIPSESLS